MLFSRSLAVSASTWLWLATSIAVCGCGDDAAPPPGESTPGEVECPDGFVDAGGTCAPVTPAEACPAGTAPILGQSSCQPVGWSDCAAPFEADPSGWGCRPVLPAESCPAGTRAALGSTTCTPVGWTECPRGFEIDPSGWGCAPVVATSACTGSTRAAIGEPGCVPVGDCSAAFPPPGATLFVDDSYTAAELDATHFATIEEAVSVAIDGDVIAVETGTYPEGITPSAAITIIGRCPELVVLEGDGLGTPGLDVVGVDGVVLRGVTLREHEFGVVSRSGAEVTVEDVVIDAPRGSGAVSVFSTTQLELTRTVIRNATPPTPSDYGIGVDIGGGGHVVLTDSEVTGSATVGILALDASSLALDRAVVQRTNVSGSEPFGHGVHVQDLSSATIQESLVAESRTLGVYVSGSGADVAIADSVIRDTQAAGAQFGIGLQVDAGGTAVVERSALVRNHFIALFLFDEASSASLTDSVILGTLPNGAVGGRGITTQDGADVSLVRTALVDNREYGIAFGIPGTEVHLDRSLIKDTRRSPGGQWGWGINASDGGTLTMTDSTVEGNHEYGVAVAKGTTATVSGTLTRGTFRAPGVVLDQSGYKVQGIGVQEGAALSLTDSAVMGNQHVGLYVWDAEAPATPSTVHAERVVVSGTLPETQEGTGNAAGILVGLGTQVALAQVASVDNVALGILVTDPGAVATLSEVVIRGTLANDLGIAGRALEVDFGAIAVVERSAFVQNREITMFVSSGSSVEANRLFIGETLSDGIGITGRGAEVQYGGVLNMFESTILAGWEAGLFDVGAGTRVSLVKSIVGTTQPRPADGLFGHNIVVSEGGFLTLDRSRIYGAASIGVAFSASTGAIRASHLDTNQVGVHVQDGSTLMDGSGEPAPGQVLISKDTQFVDNAARVGSGQIPLPTPGVADAL